MRFPRRLSFGWWVGGGRSRSEACKSVRCGRAAEGSQTHCEMVVLRNSRLAGYNVGMLVLAMPNIDEVDLIVAVHMIIVHDLAELHSKELLEPEVWCLPWQRHLGCLFDNCCSRESGHWPSVVVAAVEVVVVVKV